VLAVRSAGGTHKHREEESTAHHLQDTEMVHAIKRRMMVPLTKRPDDLTTRWIPPTRGRRLHVELQHTSYSTPAYHIPSR